MNSLSIAEFRRRFATERACEDYLIVSRWPDGFRCPVASCRDMNFYRLHTRRALKCKKNGHQTFLTSGTAMQGTRTPLRLWFQAAYLLSEGETEISALQLQHRLKIKRYETAYNILHKLRASMIYPFRDKLDGIVELGEAYLGGAAEGRRVKGRRSARIALVVRREKGMDGSIMAGEMRLRHIKEISNRSVISFIRDSIDLEGTIIADITDRKNYGDVKEYIDKKYTHKPHTSPTLVRSVLSDLETWIQQNFHGVSKKHLQAYLNEYAFRVNKRFYSEETFVKMEKVRREELSQRKKRLEEQWSFEAILGVSSRVSFPTYDGLYTGKWKHPKAGSYRYKKDVKGLKQLLRLLADKTHRGKYQ